MSRNQIRNRVDLPVGFRFQYGRAVPKRRPPAFIQGALTGSPFAQSLTAVGTGPITWSVTSGALPPGLLLGSSSGIISGTPTAPGAFNFIVTAANAGGSSSEQLSLTVSVPPTPPSITPSSPLPRSLPSAPTGSAYTQTLTATGTGPITWSVTSGALPAGLSLGSSTGIISGTPTLAGVFTPIITATNAGGSTSQQFILTVNAPVSVSLTPSSVSMLPSQTQTFTATVSGSANSGVTWSYSPALGGLATGTTSVVYAAPSTAPATQTVTITATSSADPTKTASAVVTLVQAVTLSVSPSTVSVSPSGTQQFTPTVLGTSNTSVTWSISPSVGTISSAGLYTAPSSVSAPETVTVTAKSAANPLQSASAVVTVTPRTFYVSSASGSDSNPGTQAAPWKTIAKVNATTFSPGQTVAFEAGGVWREQLTIWSNGSSGVPITFTSYGSGPSPVITGADVVSACMDLSRPILYRLYDRSEPGLPKRRAAQSSGIPVGACDWYVVAGHGRLTHLCVRQSR